MRSGPYIKSDNLPKSDSSTYDFLVVDFLLDRDI
jgi:hypothetical protein